MRDSYHSVLKILARGQSNIIPVRRERGPDLDPHENVPVEQAVKPGGARRRLAYERIGNSCWSRRQIAPEETGLSSYVVD